MELSLLNNYSKNMIKTYIIGDIILFVNNNFELLEQVGNYHIDKYDNFLNEQQS
jgi:hypothetical protein